MIGVLTGDLVNSTKMSAAAYSSVIDELERLIQAAHADYNANGEIYRGDGFQIQFPNPLNAITTTILIKLALHLSDASTKPVQCTLSLAYGEHDIYDKKPNTSSGPVFITSGRGLNKTPRGELSVHLQQTNQHINLLTQFLNHLLNRLTKTQAQLLYLYIEHNFAEHQVLADLTGTTRQNISNRLGNIGAYLVKDYIKMINQHLSELKEYK